MRPWRAFVKWIRWHIFDVSIVPAALETKDPNNFTPAEIAEILDLKYDGENRARGYCQMGVNHGFFTKIDKDHYKINESLIRKL